MTMIQQEWNYAYGKALREKVDEIHRTRQIPGNAEVFAPVN